MWGGCLGAHCSVLFGGRWLTGSREITLCFIVHINLFAQVFLAANMFVMTLFCVYRQLWLLAPGIALPAFFTFSLGPPTLAFFLSHCL